MPSSKLTITSQDAASQSEEALTGDLVISLAISPFQEDLSFLRRMFDDSGWKLYSAHSYREALAELNREQIPIVLCECQLPDGSWQDLLSRFAVMLEAPELIVMSHQVDAHLWAEVLNLGASDLLVTPLQEVDTGYAIGSAWLKWKYTRQRRSSSLRAVGT